MISTHLKSSAVAPDALSNTSASSVTLGKHTPHSCAEQNSTNTDNNMPTPIDAERLSFLLDGYARKDYIVQGFEKGFSIMCDSPCVKNVDVVNHVSISKNPEVAENLIMNELKYKRICGPFDSPPFDNLHVSPIKLQPKKDPNKFRLIHNLSAPYDETSINHNISEENSTVQYASIQDAISIIQKIGKNTFMAKSDIKSAFRLIPVSYCDYPRLGIKYKGKYYYDRCLAQGCSSSCKIFEEFSKALEWILTNKFKVKHCIHVLDDFLFLGATFAECNQYLQSWQSMCKYLGVPLAEDKTVGPSTNIVFLGIKLCSVSMVACLPTDKLEKYKETLNYLLKHRKISLQYMQSAIGCLQFATSVVVPGKAFVRRLINTTLGIKKPFHYVTVNTEAHKDIKMWLLFFQFYNGKTFFLSEFIENSISLHLYTDASKQACAATFGSKWFVINFPPHWQEKNIAFLEFFPIVVAIQIFGINMSNRCIQFHCDNNAIVQIINKQTSKDSDIMGLMRQFVLAALQYNIKFIATHIPGKLNQLADSLSRLQVSAEILKANHMESSPVPVPHRLQPENFKYI
jgi:hypothetical protein